MRWQIIVLTQVIGKKITKQGRRNDYVQFMF